MSSGFARVYCHHCDDWHSVWMQYWDKTYYCPVTNKRVNRDFAMKKLKEKRTKEEKTK